MSIREAPQRPSFPFAFPYISTDRRPVRDTASMAQSVQGLVAKQADLAEQMAAALIIFNMQRTQQTELFQQMVERDANARAVELKQWEGLMHSFRNLFELIFMSHVDTRDTNAEEGIDQLGSGEDGEDSDTKAVESGPTTQKDNAQARRSPPGLDARCDWVPPDVFFGERDEEQRRARRAATRSERQRLRRERLQKEKQDDKAIADVL